MDSTFENGAVLLLIAAVVAMITRRLRMPYSVGLVTAGIVLSLLSFTPRITLTKELLFTVANLIPFQPRRNNAGRTSAGKDCWSKHAGVGSLNQQRYKAGHY
jgi:hypothetical protein